MIILHLYLSWIFGKVIFKILETCRNYWIRIVIYIIGYLGLVLYT